MSCLFTVWCTGKELLRLGWLMEHLPSSLEIVDVTCKEYRGNYGVTFTLGLAGPKSEEEVK